MGLDAKILSIISGCILGLAFIFFVVSDALPSWGKVDSTTDGITYESTYGLWKACASSGGLNQCDDITCGSDGTGPCSKILAARAFVTLACIKAFIAALCLFLSIPTGDRTRQILLNAGKSLAFVCLIMGIIGVAIGINVSTGSGTGITLSWGAGSIIGIIAIIINFAGAITSVFIQ